MKIFIRRNVVEGRTYFYASRAKKTDQGMGGPYFNRDGTWLGTALDGNYTDKDQLLSDVGTWASRSAIQPTFVDET